MDEATTTRAALRRDVRFARTWLDEASWVDVARAAISEPDDLVTALTGDLPWGEGHVFRYDHWVDVPRLGSGYPLDRPPHPVLHDVHRALQHRYGVRFAAPQVAWYRASATAWPSTGTGTCAGWTTPASPCSWSATGAPSPCGPGATATPTSSPTGAR